MLRRRCPFVFGLTAICLAASAPAASAWTAESVNGTLTVSASPGEANRIDVDVAANGRIVVSDEAGPPTALGAGCLDPDEEGVASCDRTGVTTIAIRAGDLDDSVSVGDLGLSVEVYGEAGNDTLQTGSGDDLLDGGDGNDTLDAGSGNDVLRGSTGDDGLSAGVGDDLVDGGDGVDTLDGDLGDDRLIGGAGSDQIDSGAGNDVVTAGDGDDQVSGGDGNDSLVGGLGRDRLTGDEGNDFVDGSGGDDDLDGGAGNDATMGGTGNDLLQATGGTDSLDGGDGDDRLEGSEEANVLNGGAGNDTLNGFGGADLLDSGAGDDVLDGGLGPDVLIGGTGRDSVSYEAAAQGVTVTLDDVANDGQVNEGDDLRADIERVVGSAQDDTLIAGAAAVELIGGAGNDRLVGSSGADVLSGGDGSDTLDGASGSDVLAGGEGTDTVTYATRTTAVTVSVGNGIADDGQTGEGDNLFGDVERVIGSPLADILTAAAGLAVRFDGGAGTDRITLPALPAGDDAPEQSRAACGTGTDTVVASSTDAVNSDCEIVTTGGRLTRFAVQGEPSPRLRLVISSVRLRPDGQIRARVYCGSETGVRCVAGLHLNRGFKSIGRRSVTVGRGRSATVDIRINAAAARKLQRSGGAVRITLRVRDKAGASATGSAIVPVRTSDR